MSEPIGENNNLIIIEDDNQSLEPVSNHEEEHNNLLNIDEDNQSSESEKRFTVTRTLSPNFIKPRKVIVPNETIHQFTFILTILFIIVTVQTIIPQVVIAITKDKVDYIDFFKKSYWMIIVLLILLLTISLIVYFLKRAFIQRKSNFAIPLFLLYLITLTLIATFVSFYSASLSLGVTIIQLTVFSAKLIIELFSALRPKYFIQLIILYSVIFLDFILYCIIVREEIVGCFIYLVFLMIFCTYATFEFKTMLIEFCNKYHLDYEKELSIAIYSLSLINANIDVVTCCFK